MRKLVITEGESGQRLDRFLGKYMKEAPKSFLYKMLRKKNIKLNGGRAEGKEMLVLGDEVTLFLSDETVEKFREQKEICQVDGEIDIVYEDEQVLFFNKPAGLLSQKAEKDDVSLVEYLISYLPESRERAFTPGISNRLDRNTSGLVVAAKNALAARQLNEWIRNRQVRKFYLCLVMGEMTQHGMVKSFLKKDGEKNQVSISKSQSEGADEIQTLFEPLESKNGITYLRVELITGKTHQIRAQLSSMGHPLLGDTKYGNQRINQLLRRQCGLKHQLLHCCEMQFPENMEGALAELSGKAIHAPLPEKFVRIKEKLWQRGIQEG